MSLVKTAFMGREGVLFAYGYSNCNKLLNDDCLIGRWRVMPCLCTVDSDFSITRLITNAMVFPARSTPSSGRSKSAAEATSTINSTKNISGIE